MRHNQHFAHITTFILIQSKVIKNFVKDVKNRSNIENRNRTMTNHVKAFV